MFDPSNPQHDVYLSHAQRCAHMASIGVISDRLSPTQIFCIRHAKFPLHGQSHEHPTLAALEIRCLTTFERGRNGRGTWSLTLFGQEVRAHLNRRAA